MTATAVDAATSQSSAITFVNVTGASPGEQATVTISGPPNTTCRLHYVTPAGNDSNADGTGDGMTDPNGIAVWSWTIGASTNPGTGSVRVTCGDDSAVADIEIGP